MTCKQRLIGIEARLRYDEVTKEVHHMNHNYFNMSDTGEHISSLRKAKNLTQGEVAETLGVTHQAVSSWEKGMTSPDIAKLSDLANLLEVSVDTLIGNQRMARAIHKVEQQEPLLTEEICTIAPITKPDVLAQMIEASEDSNIDFESVAQLAPFIDAKQCKAMIKQLDSITMNQLVRVAPFMDDHDLFDILTEQVGDEPLRIRDISQILPFLSEQHIDQFFENTLIETQTEDLSIIGPFVSDTTLSKLVKEKLEVTPFDPKPLIGLAPFLNEETISLIINALVASKQHQYLHAFAPFM